MEGSPSEAEWIHLPGAERMPDGKRVRFEHPKNGDVVLIRHRGKYYCVAAQCHHFGGPLGTGEIEEIGDLTILKCPWHSYRVELQTGRAVDKDLNGTWKCGEVKQRTHEVRVSADGKVWVKKLAWFNLASKPLASDNYQHGGLCEKMRKKGKSTMSQPGRKNAGPAAARRARLARQRAARQRAQASSGSGGITNHFTQGRGTPRRPVPAHANSLKTQSSPPRKKARPHLSPKADSSPHIPIRRKQTSLSAFGFHPAPAKPSTRTEGVEFSFGTPMDQNPTAHSSIATELFPGSSSNSADQDLNSMDTD